MYILASLGVLTQKMEQGYYHYYYCCFCLKNTCFQEDSGAPVLLWTPYIREGCFCPKELLSSPQSTNQQLKVAQIKPWLHTFIFYCQPGQSGMSIAGLNLLKQALESYSRYTSTWELRGTGLNHISRHITLQNTSSTVLYVKCQSIVSFHIKGLMLTEQKQRSAAEK